MWEPELDSQHVKKVIDNPHLKYFKLSLFYFLNLLFESNEKNVYKTDEFRKELFDILDEDNNYYFQKEKSFYDSILD